MSSRIPPAGPRKRRLAQQPEPPANGASGSAPRQEALDQIDTAWNNARESKGDDPASRVRINLAIAQASALIYIGDAIHALREEFHWPDGQPPGPLAELFRDTTGGAA